MHTRVPGAIEACLKADEQSDKVSEAHTPVLEA